MPLNPRNTRTFHRALFGGITVKIRLHKRNDDQQQGTVTPYILFQCHKGRVTKTGEPIQGEMSVDVRTVWHIPKVELDRVGVNYLNAADKIEELVGPGTGRFWQPESPEMIDVKLFENFIDVQCVRIDPPGTVITRHEQLAS